MKRKSVLVNINPKHFWQETADEIEGTFRLSKQEQNAGVMIYDHYHLIIEKIHQGIEIELHSTFLKSPTINDEFYLNSLRITTDLENQNEFYFYYWEKGLFEKLFRLNGQYSEYRDFDKKIGFKTNRSMDIQKFLADKEIRELILNQKISIFNIQTENDVVKIKYQTSQIIWDKKTLLTEYSKYKKFINGLLETDLIKTHSL
ncbi:MAG: hypothetical protein GQ527_07945 [Bacteroidales bacterium]|nr:hypothetical protein [Bacteroidales bacterium]